MNAVRRVVAFMGGSREVVATFSRVLPTCIKALAGSGVVVPRTGRTGNRTSGFTHQSMSAVNSFTWTALQTELQESDADTALVVVPGMLRLGRTPSRRVHLMRRLGMLCDEVVVVSVIGDQLTLINDAYVSQVSGWRTPRRLDGLLPRLLDNEAFVHESVLRPWYDDPAAHYTAVPLPAFRTGHPVAAVLAACGVEMARTPSGSVEVPARLGPVGIEAGRLVTTYLRGTIRDFDPSVPGVVTANRAALTRADKLGWCTDGFWGWTRRSAERALARFDASNHRFAQAVWDTDWTVPYPLERPCTSVDFLDLDFPVVDQVQRYVAGSARRVRRELAAAT